MTLSDLMESASADPVLAGAVALKILAEQIERTQDKKSCKIMQTYMEQVVDHFNPKSCDLFVIHNNTENQETNDD